MNNIPPDILWKIINILTYAIGGLMGVGLSVFVYFHKGLMRRLEAIDSDLKPMRTELSLNQQKLDDHERRIINLERRKQ